jgi:hypothetical protein
MVDRLTDRKSCSAISPFRSPAATSLWVPETRFGLFAWLLAGSSGGHLLSGTGRRFHRAGVDFHRRTSDPVSPGLIGRGSLGVASGFAWGESESFAAMVLRINELLQARSHIDGRPSLETRPHGTGGAQASAKTGMAQTAIGDHRSVYGLCVFLRARRWAAAGCRSAQTA